ncbi:hypothetical protein [Streptomyces avermitilis]|uniref:hypothetical protein n=1 Tax=Streptomyces avermitilis TaxID=33903 RepID=UPI003812C976
MAALFGLGGTLVGAAVSTGAVVWQQRHQAKTAKAQQIEERGRVAGDKVLAELYTQRRYLMECSNEDFRDENPRWRRTAMKHMDAVELETGLIPLAEEVRKRVKEAVDLAESGVIYALRAQLGATRELGYLFGGCNESIEVVSAYMRGDPLPAPSHWVEKRKKEVQRGLGRNFPVHHRSGQN